MKLMMAKPTQWVMIMNLIMMKLNHLRTQEIMTTQKKVIKLGRTFMAEQEQKMGQLLLHQQQMERRLVKVVVVVNTCLLQPERLWRRSKVKVRRKNFSFSALPSS